MLSVPVDPLGDADGSRRALAAARAAGATHLAAGIRAHSVAHYVEQLGALDALEP
jgi:hypothetical protein